MKKIAIVGGLGPESTIEYYKGIIAAFHSSYDQTGYPEITIESCNLKEMVSYSSNDQWDKLANVLARKCNVLQQAGCDFGAIASNTPHKVFDQIQLQTTLPLISIIESACQYTLDKGFKRLCLLGTGFTMKSDFYQTKFHDNNMELFVPDADGIDYIHEKIFSELEYGIIKPDTKQQFIAITERVVKENNCQAAIMGCTELPLIIKPDDLSIAYIDPMIIHIHKIVEICKAE